MSHQSFFERVVAAFRTGGNSTPVSKTSAVTPTAMAEYVARTNAFAFDLFGQLAAGSDPATMDVFFSPVSVAAVLGFALHGATSDSPVEEELRALLHYKQNENSAKTEKENTGETPDPPTLTPVPSEPKKVQLLMANSLWLRSPDSVKPDYKTLLADHYKADVMPLPSNPDPINTWVAGATDGLITTLLTQVPKDVFALLINAVFFKGSWTNAFDPANTKPDVLFRQPPHAATETPKRVQMMIQRDKNFRYGEASLSKGSLCMVELPYGEKEEYAAVVLLPQGEATLDTAVAEVVEWDRWMTSLSPHPVKVDYLGLPRFKLEYGVHSLKPALTALGLKTAWPEDLSEGKFEKMTDDPTASIADVLHKAAVEVNEEGTKAAAASAVIMQTRSVRKDTREIYVDAPFLFAVRNKSTGLLLFLGRVDNPQ